MKIFIIMAVRNAPDELIAIVEAYLAKLERDGHEVHYPPRDADQSDPIGNRICETHRRKMWECDRVDIFWDSQSFGSHFDLGMAYMAGKPLKLIHIVRPDPDGKSYLKLIMATQDSQRKMLQSISASQLHLEEDFL